MTVKTELEQRYREDNCLDECTVPPEVQCSGKPHTHITKNGFVVECYHNCKNILSSGAFWLGVTVSFPIEHFLWTKVPGFAHVAEWLGLFSH